MYTTSLANKQRMREFLHTVTSLGCEEVEQTVEDSTHVTLHIPTYLSGIVVHIWFDDSDNLLTQVTEFRLRGLRQ